MTPSEIQNAVRDILAKDETLLAAGIEALTMDDGALKAAIGKAHALGGKGIVAIVSAPSFRPTSSAAKNAVGNVTMQVVVAENPMTNRAQAGHLHALQAAERIAWILNLTKPVPADPLCDVLVLDGQGIVPQPQEDGEGLIVGVTFRCQHQLRGDPPTQTI